MKAAVLEELEQIKIVEKPDPVCGDDEVIIAPQAVSVCGSDVRIFHYGNDRVETPTVIGHEVAGEVIEIGGETLDRGGPEESVNSGCVLEDKLGVGRFADGATMAEDHHIFPCLFGGCSHG